MSFLIGLDLGQAQDPTATAVIERLSKGDSPASYQCRHLDRFALGTSYPSVVQQVKALALAPQLSRTVDSVSLLAAVGGGMRRRREEIVVRPRLVVDATGVGRPVVDMLRVAGLEPIAITITGGDAVTFDGGYRVPKRDLVSVMQVLLQSGRFKIASALPYAQTLTSELLQFRVKINELTAHDSYGAFRDREHDDLVLAVAVACWLGEHEPKPRDLDPHNWSHARIGA